MATNPRSISGGALNLAVKELIIEDSTFVENKAGKEAGGRGTGAAIAFFGNDYSSTDRYITI